MMMKKTAIGIALVSLALVSGCSGDDNTEDTIVETGASTPDAEVTEEPTEDAGGGAATTLTAVVGEEDDPDAFTIMLMDDSGEMVTDLPAGDYTIDVTDLSDIHNFHLVGGDVDETTTVDEITETTWDVTFAPGDYTYKCDPHPPMTGSFTVS